MQLEDIKKNLEEVLKITQQKVGGILSSHVSKDLFENIKFQQYKLKDICLLEIVNEKLLNLQITNKNIDIKKLLEFLQKIYKNYSFKIVNKYLQCELLLFEESKEFAKKHAKQIIEEGRVLSRNLRHDYSKYIKNNIKNDKEKTLLEKNFETFFKDFNTKMESLLKKI